jgi:hypothetical protein
VLFSSKTAESTTTTLSVLTQKSEKKALLMRASMKVVSCTLFNVQYDWNSQSPSTVPIHPLTHCFVFFIGMCGFDLVERFVERKWVSSMGMACITFLVYWQATDERIRGRHRVETVWKMMNRGNCRASPPFSPSNLRLCVYYHC